MKTQVLKSHPKAIIERYTSTTDNRRLWAVYPYKHAVNYIGLGATKEIAWNLAAEVCKIEKTLRSLAKDKTNGWQKEMADQLTCVEFVDAEIC